MNQEEHPVLREFNELWDAAWSRVVEGPVDALDEVIARFEEDAERCLADAAREDGPGAVAAVFSHWDQRAQLQVMQWGMEAPMQEGLRAHEEEAAAGDRCFAEAEQRGLTYRKVQAYGTPGDPYAFLAYARDHPEDPVAAELLRCLQAVDQDSREATQGFESREAAVPELHAAAKRARDRALPAAAQVVATRPAPGEEMTGDSSEGAGPPEQPPFDEREFLGWRIRHHLVQASQKASVPPDMQVFQATFTMMLAELVALAEKLGIDPDAASDADVARYLLTLFATAEYQRVMNGSPEIREWMAAQQRGEIAPPPPSYARVAQLAGLPGRITVGISDREALDLLRQHGLRLPSRGGEPACSLCRSVGPLGKDGLCSRCRAVVAVWQRTGRATEQGWEIDRATVIPWAVLAQHIAALFAYFGFANEPDSELPAEPSPSEIDRAFEEWIRRMTEAGQRMAKVVRGALEGNEPPTVEVIERIRMPFTQAFGATGGAAYAAAAFEHYAATDPWAWDPGRDLQEGMRDAVRSALESLFPEGFLDKWKDWLQRVGIDLEKEVPEGSTYVPEFAKYPIYVPGDPHWYCKYCGKRLQGLGEICGSCADAERPWCRNCGWPKSGHSGEKLFCPARPRPAR